MTYRLTIETYMVWWWRWLVVPLVLTLALFGIGPFWGWVDRVASRATRNRLTMEKVA